MELNDVLAVVRDFILNNLNARAGSLVPLKAGYYDDSDDWVVDMNFVQDASGLWKIAHLRVDDSSEQVRSFEII